MAISDSKSGSGRVSVLLLHGSFHGSWCWEPLMDFLPGSWEVMIPDLPYEQDGLASASGAMAAAIRQLGDAPVVVAHSLAGQALPDAIVQSGVRPGLSVFLDAFVPVAGESALAAIGPAASALEATRLGEQYLPPPPQLFGIENEDAVSKIAQKLRPVSVKVHTDASRSGATEVCGGTAGYIHCLRFPAFSAMAARARNAGWPVYELDTGHDAMILEPERLAGLLQAMITHVMDKQCL